MRTAAFFAFLALLPFTAAADITGKPRIIDGDTIAIAGQRIRLHGIDAPETEQTCLTKGQRWACGRNATFAVNGGVKLVQRAA